MKTKLKTKTSKRPFGKWSVTKILLRILTIAGICVLYYIVSSLFFDTPIESEIKKSNKKLDEQYTILQGRYDSIHKVLGNIIDRDIEIHKTLFESEPYTTRQDSMEMTYKFKLEWWMSKSNSELGDELMSRTGLLYQRVYNINAEMQSLQKYVVDNKSKINSIPAIQPIDNPDFSLLITSFGNRIQPFYKTMKMHNGVDFSIPSGTAVFATADGIVSEIQSQGLSTGISVKVKHNNNYETFYANLGRVIAMVGSRINRGDVIAFSGNSGMSFAPHLHYEVRYKGKPIDPINYFFLEVDIHNKERLHQVAATGMQSFD